MEKDKSFRITPEKFSITTGVDDQIIFSEKSLRGICPPMKIEGLSLSEIDKIRRRQSDRSIHPEGLEQSGDTGYSSQP